MNTGTLTPRSADAVVEARFSGNFGQPTGFGSVLTAVVRKSGDACLTLTYCTDFYGDNEHTWSIELTNEQRKELSSLLASYEPTLVQVVRNDAH